MADKNNINTTSISTQHLWMKDLCRECANFMSYCGLFSRSDKYNRFDSLDSKSLCYHVEIKPDSSTVDFQSQI